jgi:serine beta-lactamase-like protein LACTB
MSNTRMPRWASIIVLAIAVLIVAIPGLWLYVRLTATKLHPDPRQIPSVANFPPSPKWAEVVEQERDVVRSSLSEGNLPGMSVAVGIDGEIVWAEGFGFANLENSVPVTPDHRFRIGTATIALTSAGLGVLLEEGRLKLDDEIQTYVPEFGEKQWPATIRQVMGHIGGVKGEDPDDGVLTSSHCEQTTHALHLFAKEPISQPGVEYRFSTFGWILLTAVVERVANQPLTTFLEERVFRPLGMLDTVKDSVTEPIPNEATSYFPKFAARPIYGVKPLYKFDYSCYAGSAGYLSTPSDLVRFGMGINGGKLLRRDTVQRLQTPQRLASGAETGYGLGWELKTVTAGGHLIRAAGHDGTVFVGTLASLLTIPERGITVAVISNISSFEGTSALAEKIAQAFAISPGGRK